MQQRREEKFSMVPLSINTLQAQILGLPMRDTRSILLAFDGVQPVGYVHTTFALDEKGHDFDYTTGQICFLCIDPDCPNATSVASELIQAGENYLIGLGAQTIFGGSPPPSAPFYTGFYSGGEAVGFLYSDSAIIHAFHIANYEIHQKSVWFHFDLNAQTPSVTEDTISYYTDLEVEIRETHGSKAWSEGCVLANGIWFDVTAYLTQTRRPIARLRMRIAYPDTENILTMYGGTWLASLIELRVHPNFVGKGVATFVLKELILYLAAQNQHFQVEAHAVEGSPLFDLLRSQMWQERDSGCVFIKTL